MTETPDPLLEALPLASTLLAPVAAADWLAVSDSTLVGLLGTVERVGRLVDAIRGQAAAEVHARSARELGEEGLAARAGYARAVHLIEEHTHSSGAEAAHRVRVGAAMRPRVGLTGELLPAAFPIVAEAVRSGTVGVDAATVIIRVLEQAARSGQVNPSAFTAAEDSLVDTARRVTVDLVETEGILWRERLDPDGAEPRYEQIRRQVGVRVGRERNGITTTTIRSGPEDTALLRAAFTDSTAPAAIPRFLSDHDRERGTQTTIDSDGIETVSIVDVRSREQRLYDIFFGVFLAGVRTTRSGAVEVRTTATVTAVITLGDLKEGTGAGWLDDAVEPIPASVVQELVCDAGFRAMVVGNRGEPLYEGALRRYFTPAQRRALGVRDGGCVSPNCTAPPSWCHAHHVQFWEHDGPTDIDNGVLLCARHHHDLHQGKFDIQMIDGKPYLRRPSWIDPTGTWYPVGKTRALSTSPTAA
jgi:hypothetical protein